jgi:hypothetical protein
MCHSFVVGRLEMLFLLYQNQIRPTKFSADHDPVACTKFHRDTFTIFGDEI